MRCISERMRQTCFGTIFAAAGRVDGVYSHASTSQFNQPICVRRHGRSSPAPLRYPYEVRDASEYFDDIQDVKITKDMLDLARHIVEQKSWHFERERFEDHYKAALAELLAKQKDQALSQDHFVERTNII
jgi:hypothetical protein